MMPTPDTERQAIRNWQQFNERVRHFESLPRIRFNTAIRSATSDTTLVHGEDGTLFVDTSGGVVTVTLPASTNQAGRIFIVTDSGGSAGTDAITVDTTGAETIDGAASLDIDSDFGHFQLQTNGSDWFTIAGGGAGANGTIVGIEVPPTTAAWQDLVVPDTVGDGTGAFATGITGSNGITYYVNWATNSGLAAGSLAPANATWAIFILRVIDSVGTDNIRMLISPRAAEDPPTIDGFAMKPNVTGCVQNVFVPIGTTQTTAFRSLGPGGSFLSQSWQVRLRGYVLG